MHRINTSLTEQVPEETRTKFGILVSITETGTTTLTPVFDNAITSADGPTRGVRNSLCNRPQYKHMERALRIIHLSPEGGAQSDIQDAP